MDGDTGALVTEISSRDDFSAFLKHPAISTDADELDLSMDDESMQLQYPIDFEGVETDSAQRVIDLAGIA